MQPHTNRDARRGERGAALIVALIALVALLGIGGITMLAVQSETRSSGNDRFQQMAMYAAESGAAVGMEFLRNNCSTTNLFSDWVEPGNVNPQRPVTIAGNLKLPGQAGNTFDAFLAAGDPPNQLWYEVTLLNNPEDTGLAAGNDLDGQIVLRVTGHGPNQTTVTLEMVVYSQSCVATFCEQDFAQKGITARNDAIAACSNQVDPAAALRTFTPN